MSRASSVMWPVGLVLVLWGTDALADGVLTSPSSLGPSVRARLERGVEQARREHPRDFAAIRSLRGHLRASYRRFRDQRPNVLPELHGLGAGGGWALIDAIVFTPVDRGEATHEQWDAVREGLLLALGDRRMPEAGPVLRQLFTSPQSDWATLRAAAVGLGKLGGDGERAALLAALEQEGPRRDAALWGLRYVRRREVVRAVAPLLAVRSERTVRLAARTLGYVGSSWAWKTGRAGRPEDELPIRTRCAEALLDAFLRHEGAVREQMVRCLAMVGHPAVESMIAERRADVVDREDRLALDGLVKRLRR